MKKVIFSSLVLFVLCFFSVFIFSQSKVRFDVSNSKSISPNLGLSEDTINFELSIEKPDKHILFFRSHSYDYFSLEDSSGMVFFVK